MSEYSISTDYLNVLNAKVNNLHDFVTRSSTSSSTPESSISMFKLMCIAFILFFLGYTIYTYLDKQGVFEDDIPETTEHSSNSPETKSKKPLSNTNNANNSNIQRLEYTVKNLNKKKVRFENDNTNNNLQNNKKSKGGQFCYLGSDRGFRSCAKLQDNQECESQKLFPTMEMCINPQLRYT